MGYLRQSTVRVTTTGSDGSATGTGYSLYPILGEVLAVYVDYSADAPNTTDIDVTTESDDDAPASVLVDKDNSNTDAWYYPRVQGTSTAGVGISGEYSPVPASGRVKVVIGDCDALTTAVVVTVFYRD